MGDSFIQELPAFFAIFGKMKLKVRSSMPKFSQAQKQTLFYGFILLSLVPFHWRSFFMGPTAIHLWAAADWYALALGFLDNGMDFFHPQVNQLNLQFSGTLSPGELRGITSVDFPINPYIVAWVMKMLGTNNPIIYRAYTLILSLIGLHFLFRAAQVRSHNFYYAVFVVAFIRFQPAFAYYMDGFMPTQNALSTFFVGVYFLSKHYNTHKKGHWLAVVFFFTLAGLMRLPFVIPMFAIFCTAILLSFHKKKVYGFTILSSLLGLGLILAYYIYNVILAKNYGTLFLSQLMPPRNLNDILFYWLGGSLRNSISFLPFAHVFMVIVMGTFVYRYVRTIVLDDQNKAILLFLIIHFIGVIIYSVLLARQLYAHDYYFNDFFIPALVLAIIWGSKFLQYINQTAAKLFIILFVLASFQSAYLWQKNAYNLGVTSRPEITSTKNFEGASVFLNAHNVSKEARLLVVGTYAPSIAGNATKRKCFGVRIPETKAINEALNWPFDYIITQNSFYKDVLEECPNWELMTRPLATNGKITLHVLRSRE